MQIVNPQVFEGIFKNQGSRIAGVRAVLDFINAGLKQHAEGQKGGFAPTQVSIKGLALTFGLLNPFDFEGSFERLCNNCKSMDPSKVDYEQVLSESNPGLMTNAFQIAVGALLSAMVIEGYKDDTGFIGDQLVTVVPAKRRNQKIHGFTALGGPAEVAEGHPYSETDFAEKYVTTKETKKGRIISLTEELILLDGTGSIANLCKDLGYWVRQERERTIVRGVIDADSGSSQYVYRPSGTGEALYNSDASNQNYIGSGGVTGFSTAVPLADWQSLDTVLNYRNTKVLDDRIDGDPQPIAGLNSSRNIILCAGKKYSTAWSVAHATEVATLTNSGNTKTKFDSPMAPFIGGILQSPFIDAVNADDWYYGDFKRQFIWTEIWPVQTFVQGADSEAGFERDCGLRVKVRYLGGLSARDSVFVTKIDGA